MKKTFACGLIFLASANHAQTYHEKKQAYVDALHEVMRNTPPELEQRLKMKFDHATHRKADAFLLNEFKAFCKENEHTLNDVLKKLYTIVITTEQDLHEAENRR